MFSRSMKWAAKRSKRDTIDKWYNRGEDGIYYENKAVLQADENSFVSLRYRFAKDKNYIFYKGEVLRHADLQTFTVNPETGIGSDKSGLCIHDAFAKGKSPVYTLLPGLGIQNADRIQIPYLADMDGIVESIGHPWQEYIPINPVVKSGMLMQEDGTQLWGWDYRHLGMVLMLNREGKLCQFMFRPDYEHQMGCKITYKKKSIFDISLRKLSPLYKLGFEEVLHPDYRILRNSTDGVELWIKSGKEMNLPASEEVFPQDSYFITYMKFFFPGHL